MAKRRKIADENSYANGATDVDAMFARVVTDIANKRGKVGEVVSEREDELAVLPVPSLAMRYLLQSSGWLLSRVAEIVGPNGSYKSKFAVEMSRWHALCNGRAVLLEAEDKSTPDLRNAVLHYDTTRLKVERCESLESWQRLAMWYTKEFKRVCGLASGPGPTIPFAIIVDSLLGKACEHTIKRVQTSGCAQRDFAHEANLLKTWLQVYPSALNEWPFSFIGVNHVKPGVDEHGNAVRRVPGGESVKYYEALQIELNIAKRLTDYANYSQAMVSMTTHKNSYGRNNLRIQVPLTFWTQRDEAGTSRLYSRWEWWIATTLLLTGTGMSDAKKKAIMPRIAEVLDIHEKSRGAAGKGYWSTALGIPSSDAVSAHEFGVAIEGQTDVLNDLYAALGIEHRPFFMPGVQYLGSHAGYETVIAQAQLSQQQYDLRMSKQTAEPPPVQALDPTSSELQEDG